MAKSSLALLLFLCFAKLSAQQQIRGVISSAEGPVAGITVMNLVTEQVVASDGAGRFSLPANEGDLLIFSSVNYEYKRRLIEAEDLALGEISISLIPKVTKLEEVVVYPDIMPEDLGIPAGKIKHTPAERAWAAGGEFEPTIFLIPVPVIIIPVDPIINAITGRRSMLRKELAVEKKELYLEKVRQRFPAEYVGRRYQIAPDRVEGFYFFLIEEADFVTALEENNRTRMQFVMAQQSLVYNKLSKQ